MYLLSKSAWGKLQELGKCLPKPMMKWYDVMTCACAHDPVSQML